MTPVTSPGRIEMLNGVPIYFEVHGSGDPLLLLHGFSGCSQDWSAFIGSQSHSTGEEFQRIIPDLRGHGRSFVPRDGGPCWHEKRTAWIDCAAWVFCVAA